MRILHRIKSAMLRRALIRQRAENIRNLRAGRTAAKRIKIEMVRNLRLAGSEKRPARESFAGFLSFFRKSKGRIAAGQSKGQESPFLAQIGRAA